jgi:5,6-dimethylbenzimidazole synthase
MTNAPDFDVDFQTKLEDLFRWRRDVRRFRTDPVDDGLIERLVGMAALAPSVGYSRPWRFVRVDDPERRNIVRGIFEHCNAEALSGYTGDRAQLYAQLKLAGLNDAPVQLAVFNDDGTERGHGLGRKTMPEMLRYSTVTAVYTFWLAARAHGIGVGWVSILNPEAVCRTIDVPPSWSLVAYLCVGLPIEEHAEPELERAGWEQRENAAAVLLSR